MALTAAQKLARQGKLTGSAIGVLMEGNQEAILNLYYELTGDARYVHDDLTGAWPPQLGSHTEIFSLHWYALKKGYGPLIKEAKTTTDESGALVTEIISLYPNKLMRLGEMVIHPKYSWAAATLDAWDDEIKSVVECKHCGAHRKLPDVMAKYAPQLHWQMFITGTRKIILRIILGANEAADYTVEFDDFYWSTLWDRAQKFWKQVETRSMNIDAAPVTAAPQAQAMVEKVMRTVNLVTMAYKKQVLPNWAPDIQNELDVWIDTVEHAKTHEKSIVKIKELLPSDVGHLIHAGVQVKRSKTGAVTIVKDKE